MCRERDRPERFVRLTVDPHGSVVIDFRGKLGGRGAWCHPRCLLELERTPKRLQRPLRCKTDGADWRAQFDHALRRALEDGLSMAAASGALVGGRVVLIQALKDQALREVVLASDASDRTIRDLQGAAFDEVCFTVVPFLTTAQLGARIGKGMRAAVGVRPSRAARHLLRQLQTLRTLG